MTGGHKMNKLLKISSNLQLILTMDELKKMLKEKVRFTVPRKEFDELESNELFAAATKEGFSKETLKAMFEPKIDFLLEKINWKKIQGSSVTLLAKILLDDEQIDLSSIDGAFLFAYADANNILDEFLTPEFKKQYIFSEACKLTVEKGNISFNTAIKRTINKMQSDSFIQSEIENAKEALSNFANLINPWIEFYFENENELLATFIAYKIMDLVDEL